MIGFTNAYGIDPVSLYYVWVVISMEEPDFMDYENGVQKFVFYYLKLLLGNLIMFHRFRENSTGLVQCELDCHLHLCG